MITFIANLLLSVPVNEYIVQYVMCLRQNVMVFDLVSGL